MASHMTPKDPLPSTVLTVHEPVTDRELAARTGIPKRTFQAWRMRGFGPPFRIERLDSAGRPCRVRYDLHAALRWLKDNTTISVRRR